MPNLLKIIFTRILLGAALLCTLLPHAFSEEHALSEQAPSHKTIIIVGATNIGLATSARLAQEKNNTVILVEPNQKKVATILDRTFQFHLAGLEEAIHNSITNGNLIFVSSIAQAFDYDASLLYLCLDTPFLADKTEDLSLLWDTVTAIGQNIKKDCIVINQTTAPVGTTEEIKIVIESELEKRNIQKTFDVAYHSEFLQDYKSLKDFLTPVSIILGVENKKTKELLISTYETFSKDKKTLIFMGINDAELAQYASSAMRATNTSFISQIALLADAVGADFEQVKRGLPKKNNQVFFYNTLDNIESHFSKELQVLINTGVKNNQEMSLIQKVNKINKNNKKLFVQKIVNYFDNDISQKHIGIWGIVSRNGAHSIINAPSIDIIAELLKKGACITVYDPVVHEDLKTIFGKKIRYAKNTGAILKACDFLIILTKTDEFTNYKPEQFLTLKDKIVFDEAGCFKPSIMIKAGIKYFVTGRDIYLKDILSKAKTHTQKKQELKHSKKLISESEYFENLLLENVMAHVFEDSIQNIDWIKSKSFSPRGFAANYSFLYVLFRVLNDIQPQSILEFGIGQSSKLTSQYIAYGKNTDTHLTLVEHDGLWVDIFKKQLPECNRINLLKLDLQDIEIARGAQKFQTTTYKDLDKNIGNQKFDFIIVDGPNGTLHFSRSTILSLLEHNLADSFVIIIDDYNRVGEQETAQKVISKLDDLSIQYQTTKYKGITAQFVIYSPCHSFLKTL